MPCHFDAAPETAQLLLPRLRWALHAHTWRHLQLPAGKPSLERLNCYALTIETGTRANFDGRAGREDAERTNVLLRVRPPRVLTLER